MKKKCLALLDTLNEGEEALKHLLKSGQTDHILPLLEDMQQAAIAIGTAIEQQEGESCSTVTLLEDYCDLLYQCTDPVRPKVVQTHNRLVKLHKQIRKSIQNEVRSICEVVLFPYKASMWDSLESVWRAAAENPNCRVFVVPIPYYDKNPDGSFGEMHFEGGCFPDYVPVVHWKDYSVQDRKPDIAFIHNPYDNGNYVTSVHPDFYAEKLKKFVKYLAYIPYFVAGNTIPEHFCVNAGTIYADRVFVESECVAEQYRYHFQNFVRNRGLESVFSSQIIKEKFQGLGSPKIDQAVSCRKEDYVLPDTWAKRLRGKKAILYNSGIGGILSGNEQELRKIRDVIQFFKKKNDVVLWWRPHPLSVSTITSMRPQLLEQYQKLVEWFQKENCGIYDTSSNLYRAIAYTDMFYGDWSSVMYLYGVQGKPILLQNQDFLLLSSDCTEDKTLYFNDCTYEDQKIWFSDSLRNGLYEISLTSGAVSYLGQIPGEAEAVYYLYGRILKKNGSLWLVPVRAAELLQYDLIQKKFVKHTLPQPESGISAKLQYAFLIKEKLYMFAGDYSRIVIFDTQEGGVEEVRLQVKVPSLYCECPCGMLPEGCVVDSYLYFTMYGTNTVIEFDTETRNVKHYHVGDAENQYIHILYDGTCFWLIPYVSKSGEIICWNKTDGQIRAISNYPKEFRHINWFAAACFQNCFLWLFPSSGSHLIKINIKTFEMTAVPWISNKHRILFAKALADGGFITDSYFSYSRHQLIRLDVTGRLIGEYKVSGEKHTSSGCQCMPWQEDYGNLSDYIIAETKEFHLLDILNWIKQANCNMVYERQCFKKVFGDENGTAGKKILKYMQTLCDVD